jgi:hypothetical protein
VSGIQPQRVFIEEMLADVKRVVLEHHGDTRINTYRAHGKYAPNTIMKHFDDSWHSVLAAADPRFESRKVHHMAEDKPKDIKKKRLCLGPGCNRLFMSWGAANRKCPKCRQTNLHQSGEEDEFCRLYVPSRNVGLS